MGVRARRSEETAERVRSEALQLFLSRSYAEVTLAEVAAAAGVTVPTLIAHFGRKEDLFVAACGVGAASVMEEGNEAPVGDHAGAVRNLLDGYEAHGKSILHFLAEEDRFPAVRVMTDVGRGYHRAWVERVFEPEMGGVRGANRERLFVQLMVATDLLAWKVMRLDMKLSRRQTEAAMVGTIDALTGGG
jgi:AcrR family transcriptional regulator